MPEINGWKDVPRADVVLDAGDNDDVIAQEHLVLYTSGASTRVTGFEPPTTEHTWVMSVSNGGNFAGGVEDIIFPHDDAGSTDGWRTMMPPGSSIYTLALGETVYFAYSPAPVPGWYPVVAGVMS